MSFSAAVTSVDLGINLKYSSNMYLLTSFIRQVCFGVTVQSCSQNMGPKQTHMHEGKLTRAFCLISKEQLILYNVICLFYMLVCSIKSLKSIFTVDF